MGVMGGYGGYGIGGYPVIENGGQFNSEVKTGGNLTGGYGGYDIGGKPVIGNRIRGQNVGLPEIVTTQPTLK